MKEDISVFIGHILDSIKMIGQFTKDTSKQGFLKDVKLQDAIIRRIEIIGEAAKNIPQEFKDKHPDIPWAEMARTRDKLIAQLFDFGTFQGLCYKENSNSKSSIIKEFSYYSRIFRRRLGAYMEYC